MNRREFMRGCAKAACVVPLAAGAVGVGHEPLSLDAIVQILRADGGMGAS